MNDELSVSNSPRLVNLTPFQLGLLTGIRNAPYGGFRADLYPALYRVSRAALRQLIALGYVERCGEWYVITASGRATLKAWAK